MSSIIETVIAAISPFIQSPYELVDVEYGKLGGDYILSVFVDKEGGITLQDTADLSEIISPILDTIQPDPFPEQYMLEVTSPGLERPLKTPDALAKAIGKYIHVSLYQAIDKVKIFEGTLVSFDGDELILNYMDKNCQKEITIPYQAVAKARLAVKV
ncbi:ribosome maturation factor RimP [Streptococcus suis]|nr:ribosome maturation factor RimP [Streptococcus suis]